MQFASVAFFFTGRKLRLCDTDIFEVLNKNTTAFEKRTLHGKALFLSDSYKEELSVRQDLLSFCVTFLKCDSLLSVN